MENFNIVDIPAFEDEKAQALVDVLKAAFEKSQSNFAKICEGVYKIWSYFKNQYFNAKNNEYYNSYALLAKFGFDKKAVSRYKSCYERFIVPVGNNNVRVTTMFDDFSPSKLFELLPLKDNVLIDCVNKKILRPEMTVKKIRKAVKLIVNGEDPEQLSDATIQTHEPEIDESEIPPAYDPTQKYEFEYFQSKTKNQLLNMIWELQKSYWKIRGQR